MKIAAMTKDVSNQLAAQLTDVADRYQVPQRLRRATDTARRGAEYAYDNAYRGARHAYALARAHPRTSAAAGVLVTAAIVGGVLWYLFGRETEEQRQRRRVRAGTGRKRAKTTRASTRTSAQ